MSTRCRAKSLSSSAIFVGAGMGLSCSSAFQGEHGELDVILKRGDSLGWGEAQHPADEREVDTVLILDGEHRLKIRLHDVEAYHERTKRGGHRV